MAFYGVPPPQFQTTYGQSSFDAPPLYGKTVYKYVTADGGPPGMGAPPKSSAPAFPPGWPAAAPQPPPPYPGWGFSAPTCGGPSPYFFNVPAPQQPFVFGSPPPQPPPTFVPAPQEPQYASGISQSKKEPLSGNRVKDQLASFPDQKMGYIFPKRNVIFHIFHENVINKYSFPGARSFTIPNYTKELWSAECVAWGTSVKDFLEGIDCRKRADEEARRCNRPSPPDYAIGVQMLLEDGPNSGRFILGSKIMMADDPYCELPVGTIWPEATGEAGQIKPPFLVRLPFCKSLNVLRNRILLTIAGKRMTIHAGTSLGGTAFTESWV